MTGPEHSYRPSRIRFFLRYCARGDHRWWQPEGIYTKAWCRDCGIGRPEFTARRLTINASGSPTDITTWSEVLGPPNSVSPEVNHYIRNRNLAIIFSVLAFLSAIVAVASKVIS